MRTSRVQAERDGAAMRQRLLDAAVECLIELGVAGTTTLAVQRRARASRGALLHHFPTHADLLAASVAELVKRNEQAVVSSRADARPADLLRAAVNAMAFAGRQPSYLAELELWAVARTDRPLRQALMAAERLAKRDIERVSAELFAPWAGAEGYDDAVSLTQHFVRGLAISENLRSSPARRERLISVWTDAIRPLLKHRARKASR